VTQPKPEAPEFEKEVVRLPDGRTLTYYRFPGAPPRPAAGAGAPAPDRKGEKGS
jgi:hypothetical protein